MIFTTIGNAKKQTGLSYLGAINSSAKIIKNIKVSNNYTYILYLSPASTSGYNVCSHSTNDCRKGCINTSGRVKMEKVGHSLITNARIKKTKLFFEDRQFFMNWLIAEIKMYQKKAIKDGYDFSVRLNGTSDINWQSIRHDGQNIFEIFPDVLFYDYTKNIDKFVNNPLNYHLTYSYTGKNWDSCESVLMNHYNVAVVFDTKKGKYLPLIYKSYPVIDGDLTDFRINDGNGIIVGLRFKMIKDKIKEKEVLNSCFVVKETDNNCIKKDAFV